MMARLPLRLRKPRKKPDLRERRAHQALKGHLDLGCRQGIAWMHIPNERQGDAARIIQHTLGVKAGAPDFLIIIEGMAYGLEIKALGGVLSPAQEWMREYWTDAGGRYAVGYGVDECLSILMEWGVLRKGYMPSRRRQVSLGLEAA